MLQRLLERSGFCVVENSLDPYYVSAGVKALLHRLYYLGNLLLTLTFGINVYDTIWMVARKR